MTLIKVKCKVMILVLSLSYSKQPLRAYITAAKNAIREIESVMIRIMSRPMAFASRLFFLSRFLDIKIIFWKKYGSKIHIIVKAVSCENSVAKPISVSCVT